MDDDLFADLLPLTADDFDGGGHHDGDDDFDGAPPPFHFSPLLSEDVNTSGRSTFVHHDDERRHGRAALSSSSSSSSSSPWFCCHDLEEEEEGEGVGTIISSSSPSSSSSSSSWDRDDFLCFDAFGKKEEIGAAAFRPSVSRLSQRRVPTIAEEEEEEDDDEESSGHGGGSSSSSYLAAARTLSAILDDLGLVLKSASASAIPNPLPSSSSLATSSPPALVRLAKRLSRAYPALQKHGGDVDHLCALPPADVAASTSARRLLATRFFEQSQTGQAFIDLDGRLVDCNPQFERDCNLSPTATKDDAASDILARSGELPQMLAEIRDTTRANARLGKFTFSITVPAQQQQFQVEAEPLIGEEDGVVTAIHCWLRRTVATTKEKAREKTTPSPTTRRPLGSAKPTKKASPPDDEQWSCDRKKKSSSRSAPTQFRSTRRSSPDWRPPTTRHRRASVRKKANRSLDCGGDIFTEL